MGGIRGMLNSNRKNAIAYKQRCNKKQVGSEAKQCEKSVDPCDKLSDSCEELGDPREQSDSCYDDETTDDCAQPVQRHEETRCAVQSRSSEVQACLKPGCSLRMPCLTCTKNGCRPLNNSRDPRVRESFRTDNSCNIRSKSEARCRPRCKQVPSSSGDLRTTKRICTPPLQPKSCSPKSCEPKDSRSKCCKSDEYEPEIGKESVIKKPEIVSEDSSITSCCPSDEIREESSKSPCRKLTSCYCNSCKAKGVKFTKKSKFIPNVKCSTRSCSEDDTDESCRSRRYKRDRYSSKNPCGRSDSGRAPCCMPRARSEFRSYDTSFQQTPEESDCDMNMCNGMPIMMSKPFHLPPSSFNMQSFNLPPTSYNTTFTPFNMQRRIGVAGWPNYLCVNGRDFPTTYPGRFY